MSTITQASTNFEPSESEFDSVASYRSVSKPAIFSVGLGVLALGGLLFPALLPVAIGGFILGLIAIRNIRRYPDELVGMLPAIGGTVLCGLLFVGGTTMHVVEYLTELPDGYTSEDRHSWSELQPDKRYPELPVSPTSLELSGRKIFLKGYVHPEYNGGPVKSFVMVPDMGTCCFGGQPKVTDMIEVTLRDPLRVKYNQRLRKVAGVFQVNPAPRPIKGLGGVYYQLDAEYAK